MSCQDDFTIRFPSVNKEDSFEIRPYDMELKISRQKYDYLRARFPWEVGEQMKPLTRYSDTPLNGFSVVDVLYNGNVVKKLLFRPDYVEYGTNYTSIQLHDLQKSLADGMVDKQRELVKLEEIYEAIFNSCGNNILKRVTFSNVDSSRTLISGDLRGLHLYSPSANNDDIVYSESKTAIDFKHITPEEAIQELNKKFGVHSWVNGEQELVVGHPPDNGLYHIAAPDDDRVWRYTDANITHGSEPVEKVYIEGPWVDESGIDLDIEGWFDEGGTDEVLAYGVAEREDIETGITKSFPSKSTNKDTVPQIAESKLKKVTSETNTAKVSIAPEHSGNEISDVINVKPGDFLQLIPSDKSFEEINAETGNVRDEVDNPREQCGGVINNDIYSIKGVTHHITNQGYWQVDVEAGLFADYPIDTSLTYYHPQKEEFVSKDEIENGWIESGGLGNLI